MIDLGVSEIQIIIDSGYFKEKLIALSPSQNLIVLGKSGLEHAKKNDYKGLGQNLESIIKDTSSPVLIQKKKNFSCSNLMICFDGRQSVLKSLQCPIFLSLARNANLVHLVSIDNNIPDLAIEHERISSQLKALNINVEPAFLMKTWLSVAEQLAAYQEAHKINLTVLGAYASPKIRQFFLGSQTTKMLQQINSSLLFYR